MEKVVKYDRSIVAQLTPWWCGPASIQIVLNGRGVIVSERDIMLALEALEGNVGWDDRDGTDHIRQITTVLGRHLAVAEYRTVELPNDPPSDAQKAALWSNVKGSIDAGYGVIINIDAPSRNFPRAVLPSTTDLAYSGSRVLHYVAIMGYAEDERGRRVWWADPGFRPFGSWVSFEQTATLIPPKGYSYASVVAADGAPEHEPKPEPARPGLTAEVLAEAMGCPLARAREMLDPFIGAMRAADINTALRAAHWCAQIGHESAGLVYMEEIASGADYEWRRDLGNTQPGDGRRFKGSGPIQLTGRANFTTFSRWAHEHGHVDSPTLLVDRPELVRTDPRLGFLAASWYWVVARPQLNSLADRDDLNGVTRAINGGTNGLDDRRRRLAVCKRLGDRLLPPTDGGILMALSDAEQRELLGLMRYVAGQVGPKHEKWPPESSMGANAAGQEQTLRDGLAETRRDVKTIVKTLEAGR